MTDATLDNFNVVKRSTGNCWLHKDKPMWIVFYPDAPDGPHYQAYRPADWVLPLPKGRAPWTLPNWRLITLGFKTLEEAMRAVEETK